MNKIADYAIDMATAMGATYAYARLVHDQGQGVFVKNNEVANIVEQENLGLGIQVLVDGAWGFAGTPAITRKNRIEKAVKLAIENARASATRKRVPVCLVPEPIHRNVVWSTPYSIDPFQVPLNTKIGILIEAAKIMSSCKGVTLAEGSILIEKTRQIFANSDGSHIEQNFIMTGCSLGATAIDDKDGQSRWCPGNDGHYEMAGWEMIERMDLLTNAKRIGLEAEQVLKSPKCPSGIYDVILGSSQLAIHTHESIHGAEIDRILGKEVNYAGDSFLALDMLDDYQYASPVVNIVADATCPGALGTYAFDDEGVAGQKFDIVRNGILRGYLTSRETAHFIGLERSGGCMRAESWNRNPLIRMPNVSLEPGNAGTLEDLIASTDRGIFFDGNTSWSIDDKRYCFQFGTQVAWLIEHGKKVKMLKDANYTGITPQFWNSCDAICGPSEYKMLGILNCGKGQYPQSMWMSHGAAPARFRNVRVGPYNRLTA